MLPDKWSSLSLRTRSSESPPPTPSTPSWSGWSGGGWRGLTVSELVLSTCGSAATPPPHISLSWEHSEQVADTGAQLRLATVMYHSLYYTDHRLITLSNWFTADYYISNLLSTYSCLKQARSQQYQVKLHSCVVILQSFFWETFIFSYFLWSTLLNTEY